MCGLRINEGQSTSEDQTDQHASRRSADATLGEDANTEEGAPVSARPATPQAKPRKSGSTSAVRALLRSGRTAFRALRALRDQRENRTVTEVIDRKVLREQGKDERATGSQLIGFCGPCAPGKLQGPPSNEHPEGVGWERRDWEAPPLKDNSNLE